MQAVT